MQTSPIGGKIWRYKQMASVLKNWPTYLWKKITGFEEYFQFDVNGLGKINVLSQSLGPFRENFFDDVYLKEFPDTVLAGENPVIVDIGANVGYFSLNLLRKNNQARIYAFEPNPFCFKILKEYQSEFAHLDLNIENVAVGGETGELEMFVNDLEGFATKSGIFKQSHQNVSLKIPSISLGSLIAKENIQVVDLLKLDCEGSEYPILYNLDDSIFNKIKAICVETHEGVEEKENHEVLLSFLQDKFTNIKTSLQGNTGYIWGWRI